MTRFQALFVFYLRNEKLQGCSWRALAAHYFNRYDINGNLISLEKREVFEYLTHGGNQIDGMFLCNEASKVLFDKEVDISDQNWYYILKYELKYGKRTIKDD